MSVKSYPNERDCEHGQLRRSCPTCAADAEYAALLARHNALKDAARVALIDWRCCIVTGQSDAYDTLAALVGEEGK
jgi:hypothetical protein